jgi:hypothetical protein
MLQWVNESRVRRNNRIFESPIIIIIIISSSSSSSIVVKLHTLCKRRYDTLCQNKNRTVVKCMSN